MKKLNKNIKTLLIAAVMFFCSAGTLQAANYNGQLDNVTDDAISGWAKDSSSPDNPVKVTISVYPEGSTAAVKEITLTASEYRDSDDYSPYRSGYCGFTWNIDWSELDNGNYQVMLKAGTKTIRKALSYNNTSGMETAVATNDVAAHTAGLSTDNLKPLGVFKTTAYCPCRSCSEGWGRNTSTGAMAQANHTIAVDPRVIPYGSKIMIDGVIYTAEDRGGGVKGNHIDIFYDSHSETRQHGVRYKEAFLVQ